MNPRSNLYAMNPGGTRKWMLVIGGSGMGAPVIGADRTIFASTGENLYAVNPNGTLKWTFTPNKLSSLSSPAIGADNTIYLCSSYYYIGDAQSRAAVFTRYVPTAP